MKRLITLIVAMSATTIMIAQDCDVDGTYRVSALDVMYYGIVRNDVEVVVHDAYGAGIQIPVADLKEGDIFYALRSGPYSGQSMTESGINLNVEFNQNECTASLALGSVYPDATEENCQTTVAYLPIVDDMLFTSDRTTTGPLPTTNIVGLPSISNRAYMPGFEAGGFSLDQALVFDYFPQGPGNSGADVVEYQTCLALGGGCEAAGQGVGFDCCVHLGTQNLTLPSPILFPSDINGDLVIDENDSYPANTPFPGVHGGWLAIADENNDLGGALIGEGVEQPDLFAEWHAIDGLASESGLGDDIDVDEDNDGTIFDRVYGYGSVEATYFNPSPECSIYGTLNHPVVGDVTESIRNGVYDQCIAGVLPQVETQCDAFGSGEAAVTGLCNLTIGAMDPDLETTCLGAAATGMGEAAAVGYVSNELCLGVGFSQEQCTDLTNLIGDLGVVTCAALGASSGALCDNAGALVTSTDENGDGDNCDEWSLAVADGFAAQSAETGYLSCTDLSNGFIDNCVASVTSGNNFGMNLMDPSGNSATWNNFVTFNGVKASQCMAPCVTYVVDNYGYSEEDATGFCATTPVADPTTGPSGCADFFADDSAYDVDPTCLADGDPSDCTGRILFNFDSQCIDQYEVRQVVIEAVELGCGSGNVNGDLDENDTDGDGDTTDPLVNVLDVVAAVAHILGNTVLEDEAICAADMNDDGALNVLDIVTLVGVILSDRADSATNVEIIKTGQTVKMEADGSVGAIQMTLSHGDDFELSFTGDAFVKDHNTTGNTTTLMIVRPDGNNLFTAEGEFTIETVIAASSSDYINTEISIPVEFVIGNAYPNPFNPSTTISIDLNNEAFVSMKVFNVMGQLVDVVNESNMPAGKNTITWDASQKASGVYLINTQIGNTTHQQKIMLLK